MASYSYTDDGNYYLSALDYGNDDSVNYTYDSKGRLLTQTYEDGDTVTYKYNNDGVLASRTDSATDITTRYYYDLTGRLIKRSESNGVSISYQYDSKNNLTYISERIDGSWRGTYYTYDQDNRVTRMYKGRGARAYVYDDLGRILTEKAQYDGSEKITEAYGYQDNGDKASGQIATHTITAGENSKTYSYTYDDNGNITSISDGTNTTSYVYDSANQLIRENNQAGSYTYTWVYDEAGNIQSRKEYAYTTDSLDGITPTDTVTYTYGDSEWGDLLTEFNGNAITYDEIGNPLSDGTWNYTWEHGRELSSMTDGTTTWNYTYDADGMRIQRTNGSSTYSYVYEGGQLMRMMADNTMLNFAYDADGDPLTLLLNDSSYYFYVTNLQGDVIALTDPNGTEVVRYAYDGWGNVIAIDGSMAATLGALNPLRYRGYVYDAETGLYYLQSRYYNPEMGRFINADGFATTGQGFIGNNMFAYCLNNPINFIDRNGRDAEALLYWSGSMWWLCLADTALPIGDAIYVVGIIVLVIVALATSEEITMPIAYDNTDTTANSSPTPNRNNDDDDGDDEDYYDDDSNFGGRQKVGKRNGNTPGNNRAQNKQFKDATKGLNKAQKRAVHEEISGEGLGYHDILDVAKNLWLLLWVYL